jgi:mannose-6-phosphate isomerase-like protein (cupin superfamily)
MRNEKPIHIKSGEGTAFLWKSDHAYVKVSTAESGGRFSLVEDNLTLEFRLPRHLHRTHSETFYVVYGEVEFVLEEGTVNLKAGDTLYIPPGQPHAVRCLQAAKMLTLFEPGGLEALFAAYAAMSPEEMANDDTRRAVEVAHDNIVL